MSNSPPADSYNKVVELASLLDVMLTSSRFRASPEYIMLDTDEETDKYIDQSVDGEQHYDEDSRSLLGSVRCRVWINKASDKATELASIDEAMEKSVFFAEAVYAVLFDIPPGHSKETLAAFFERMALFATWPYFRTHVAALAAEAHIDVPVLPIKKLFHPVQSAGGYTDAVEVPGDAKPLPGS